MIEDKIRGVLKKSPLAVFNFIRNNKNKEDVIIASHYILPYSVGIEIECETPENNISTLKFKIRNVKGIMDCSVWNREISFRITNGFIGLCALYVVLEIIKTHSMLNNGSGIHYHIDCSNWLNLTTANKVKKNYSEQILENLDLWNYTSRSNSRAVTVNIKFSWLNLRTYFKTFEFRIGEMTFEYSIILDRIIMATALVTEVKTKILKEVEVEDIIYPDIKFPFLKDYYSVLDFKILSAEYEKFKNLLDSLEKQKEHKNIEDFSTYDEINEITKKRKINLYGH